MRIMIVIPGKLQKLLLVKLETKKLIEEILEHIGHSRHEDAIIAALMKGSFLREVGNSEAPHVEADLILSKTNVMWDLKK